jgi:hypothetical protein
VGEGGEGETVGRVGNNNGKLIVDGMDKVL